MSAYVITDSEFDALYTALETRFYKDGWKTLFSRLGVMDREYVLPFVERLRILNQLAVNYRYSEKEEYPFLPLMMTTAGLNLSDGALYGLVSCLHYQCSEFPEGQEPDDFKKLTELYDFLAHTVASKHEHFHWGLKDKSPDSKIVPLFG